MYRSVVAVVVGLLVGMVTIYVVKAVGHAMYPLPADVDWSRREAVAAALRDAPPGALVMVLVAWSLGTAHGAGLASYLALTSRWLHGAIVAAVLLLAAIVQLVMIPHPGWFAVWTLIVFPASAVVGMLLGTQPIPGDREGYVVKEPPDYSAEAEQRRSGRSR